MRVSFLLTVIFFVVATDGLAQFDQAYGIHPKLPNSTHVSLVDIDGDGVDEVMSCSVMTKELAFFQATEEQLFQFNSVSRNLYGASEIYTLDLDSDGDQDILAYEELEDKLVWFENDSETYNKHVIAEVPNGFALSHYDLDNDGDQDLFYAASQMNQLLLFEQTEPGVFADSSVLFEVSDIRSLHWEDIDLDGDDDLVSGGEMIGVYENLNNQLLEPAVFGGGLDNLRYENVDCYDFNQDGQLDIITKSVDNSSLFVFYQDSDLDFSSNETIASDDFLRDWCLMDIDGNGFEDVVIGADGDAVLSYLPINGSGLAGARMAINDIGIDEVHHLAVGDYNGDGETDLVISDLSQIVFCEQEVDALVRRGDMSGRAFVEYPIQLIDADDDGDQDLLLNNVEGDQLLFNNGQGDFYESGEQLSTANRNSILQDLNNDGLADLIRYELFWTDLEVKFQILEGTFGEATVLPIEYWGGDFNFTFFDVDQNGSLDIVASRLSNPICEVFLNNSGFSELDHIFYDVPILDPITVAMGDVNNDGYLDMMTCDESSTYVRWGGTDLLLGDAIQINGTGGASRIQLVDLDLDGDLDFIGYTTTGIAYQLINDESTNWPMSVIDLSTGSNEVEFCLADFNGDGFPDLAHAEPTNFQVELRYNNQEGGFLPPEIPFAGYTPSHVSAADLNGDGSQDLVIGVIDQVTGILGLMNTSLSGCTDPLACNFNSEATVDGGDCCYDCGCTDPNALNYNSMATCADGSCEYQISISVFDDLDLNAQMNGPEYMLHDILVHVEPSGVDFITDLNGSFTLDASEGES
ncbi:MAG: FG-GAP repeat domain-containing protein, partial [Flavobacteriales bacterium]